MGLDTSHDAFHGAYSAFHRFRVEVTEATGGELTQQGWFTLGDDWIFEQYPGLEIFLSHSDCGGEISPHDCVLVADALEALLPSIEARATEAHGHIAARGGFVEVTRKFIAGCRLAAAENEPLEFY